jgi:hypothetical protein
MPITNTNGIFNTGRDITLVLIGPFGQVQLDNITGFDAKQDTVDLKSNRLDGVKMNAYLPDGWSGTISVDRGSNSLDVLMAGIEANWFAGAYTNSTMFQYVNEAGGAISVFAYDNVALKLSDAGNYQPDAIVKQTLTWTANRRRIV